MPDYAGKPSSFYATTGGKPVEGAWYSGQRYLGGKLLAPGEHQPGQRVSKEVIAQTDPKNVSYIEKLRGGQPTQERPKTQEEVTPYLNQFQGELFKAQEAPEVRTPEEIKAELKPEVGLPALLDRTKEFKALRAEYGVADLEQSLTDIKAQVDEEFALLREQRGIEEGKPVPLGVIAGRISEEERTAQERIDFLGRQQSRITDELNTKYSLISTYMNFAGLDYQDAVQRYETEFNTNLKIYDLIAGERKEARSIFESDRNAAKANLQIYTNAITSGNIDYGSLDESQRIMVNKLEVQSGLPIGFISNLRMSPEDRILAFSEDKTQAWIIKDDGNLDIIQTGLRPKPSSGTTTDTKATRQSFANASINMNFPDLVEKFAPTMSLEEIYKAYANTDRGREFGDPIEDRRIMQMVWKVAHGDISEEDARLELGLD